MRNTLLLSLALIVSLAALPVEASTPNTGPKPWDSNFAGDDGPVPSAVTDHLKCVITELQDDRVVKVWDEKTRTENLVRIAEKVAIKARKKSQFDGRSKLDFSDLRVGHRIKMTYLTEDGTIVRVSVVGQVDTLPASSMQLAEGTQ